MSKCMLCGYSLYCTQSKTISSNQKDPTLQCDNIIPCTHSFHSSCLSLYLHANKSNRCCPLPFCNSHIPMSYNPTNLTRDLNLCTNDIKYAIINAHKYLNKFYIKDYEICHFKKTVYNKNLYSIDFIYLDTPYFIIVEMIDNFIKYIYINHCIKLTLF